MAKFVDQPVSSGFNAKEAINENLVNIEENFQRVLYRDGSSPNHMLADLDMNSNRIINLPTASSPTEPVTLGQFLGTATPATYYGSFIWSVVAIAAQTVFIGITPAYSPGNGNLTVYINGVRQHPTAYTETSSSSVTFTEGLSAGDAVLFVINQAIVDNTVPASLASTTTYIHGAVGSVSRTVTAKLQEVLSVKDFGAVGDGITNDTVAVQAAIDASVGKVLEWGQGPYLITTCLDVTERGSAPTVWKGHGFSVDGVVGTKLIFRTAADATSSPGWMIDFSGSQNISIEEIQCVSNGANASTKGFLFARTNTYQYVQQVYMRKVFVDVGTHPAATSVGSVAIANNQAEQFYCEHCDFRADTPFVGMLNNNISLVSPYTTIYSAILSTTVLDFVLTTFYAYTQPSMVLWGVAGSNWKSCVFAKDPANTTQYAIDLRSGGAGYNYPHALNINGQVEGFVGGVTFSSASMQAHGIVTNLFMVAVGAAVIVTAASVSLYNCYFDNPHPYNISGGINLSCGASTVVYGGSTVSYPGDLGVSGGTLYGHRIHQYASGLGLLSITPGTDMSSIAAPNAAQTDLSEDGYVQLSGILQAGAVVALGATIGTVGVAHRPNRDIYLTGFVSGVGLTYCVITSAGAISVGTGLVNLTQVNLDGIRFKRVN